jgi:hypothetical protein
MTELDIYQQKVVALGQDPERLDFGNIDDVIAAYGNRLPYQHLVVIARGRGNDPEYGSVDQDTLQWRWEDYKPGQLTLVSKGRGSNPDYKNIDNLNPHMYCFAKMRKYSHVEGRPNTDLMPFVQ